MLYRTRQQWIKIAILGGFLVTLYLAVYPDPVLRWLGFTALPTADVAVRLFPLLNGVLLALFSGDVPIIVEKGGAALLALSR
ncbi:MAG: hypothetical protein FJX48_10365 [Alphaproteobacteria bacterium]|nr:hypothetical protein [Alphaproteobacteria bacterium]